MPYLIKELQIILLYINTEEVSTYRRLDIIDKCSGANPWKII